MDFHTLARRDLQTLCKKNRIPANLTNVAMADALKSLQTVEGIDEFQELMQSLSPNKLGLVSPAPPRTRGRTSTRRVGPTEDDENKGRQASPLPRSRRVAVKASEMMDLVGGGEEEKEGPLETPKVYTRRRGIKKEEEVVKKSVATRRRAAKKEESEIKKSEEENAANATTVGVTTRRRQARQSSKKEVRGGGYSEC